MNRKNVEDLYPLTPLQQGMLFHALHSPEADAYAEQVAFTLEGEVRPGAFAQAWQAVVDRHPALRTGFVWEGVKQPMQVVFREAAVPVRVEEWSDLPPAEREARWAALLDPAGNVHVADPRLSTTYDGDGHQRRAGLELWVGGEHDYPRRAAGEVLCGSTFDLGRVRLDCAFFAWHMEGRHGVGRYDLVRRA
jgi:hypothetical protein